MKFETKDNEIEMPELRVKRDSVRKSMPLAINSGLKEKDQIFEGSEDIKISVYDENMEISLNDIQQNATLEDEGPRIGQEKMMSPKKVTNKR